MYEERTYGWLLTLAARGREMIISNPERNEMPRLERLLDQSEHRSRGLVRICRVESLTFPDVDYPTRCAAIYRSSERITALEDESTS